VDKCIFIPVNKRLKNNQLLIKINAPEKPGAFVDPVVPIAIGRTNGP